MPISESASHPLFVIMIKPKATTGRECSLADHCATCGHIQPQVPALYSLMTDWRRTSFRADNCTLVLRPRLDHNTRILRGDGFQFTVPLTGRIALLGHINYKHVIGFTHPPVQSCISDNHRSPVHGRTSFARSYELLLICSNTSTSELVLWDIDETLCLAMALSIDPYRRCISHVVSVETEFFCTHPQYHEVDLRDDLPSISYPGVGDVLEWLPNAQTSLIKPLLLPNPPTGNSHVNIPPTIVPTNPLCPFYLEGQS
jgi:hypothetical protein